MKRQVLLIHGADTFKTYEEYLTALKSKELDFERLKRKDWKEALRERLGDGFEVIKPHMPNHANARYVEWKIWFEKLIPFLKDDIILIGHSMGGIFLAKYLSENNFPKNIRATILIAAPFDEKDIKEMLGDFRLPESITRFKEQTGEVILYHSEDDPIVPFADFEKYKRELPNATARIFKDRGHFQQEELPELVEDIKNL